MPVQVLDLQEATEHYLEATSRFHSRTTLHRMATAIRLAVSAHFNRQMNAVLSIVTVKEAEIKLKEVSARPLLSTLTNSVDSAISAGGKSTLKQTRTGTVLTFDARNPQVLAYLKENLAKSITGINET